MGAEAPTCVAYWNIWNLNIQFSSELTCLPLQVVREGSRAVCISRWLQTVRIPAVSDLSHYLAYVSPALTFNLFGLVVTTLLVPCPGPEWLLSSPPQSHPPVPSCLPDIWHDLQYDPVLCYPQEPRDGLESACTPEQESLPLKIVGYFLGVLFLFWGVFFIVCFFFFFATNFSIHSAFLNKNYSIFVFLMLYSILIL